MPVSGICGTALTALVLTLACATECGANEAAGSPTKPTSVLKETPSMPALKLGSTVIYVERDAKAVLDFYVAAFGLKVRYYDPKNAHELAQPTPTQSQHLHGRRFLALPGASWVGQVPVRQPPSPPLTDVTSVTVHNRLWGSSACPPHSRGTTLPPCSAG